MPTETRRCWPHLPLLCEILERYHRAPAPYPIRSGLIPNAEFRPIQTIDGLCGPSLTTFKAASTPGDGRAVDVTIDLEGNIYSEPRNRLYIRIQPLPSNR
jgi:hypothetical protein